MFILHCENDTHKHKSKPYKHSHNAFEEDRWLWLDAKALVVAHSQWLSACQTNEVSQSGWSVHNVHLQFIPFKNASLCVCVSLSPRVLSHTEAVPNRTQFWVIIFYFAEHKSIKKSVTIMMNIWRKFHRQLQRLKTIEISLFFFLFLFFYYSVIWYLKNHQIAICSVYTSGGVQHYFQFLWGIIFWYSFINFMFKRSVDIIVNIFGFSFIFYFVSTGSVWPRF